ncbi:MAG TPA: zinc ribbon domain-containing protein [Kofleriaceae bacterium]|jgi:putative FmdB family regulatory protein
MPVYEYECKACHRDFEYQQRMSDPDKTVCEACGGALERLISKTAFALKGGGWYKDLYSSTKPEPAAPAAPSGDAPSSAKADSPSSTPAAAPSTPAPAPSSTGSSGSGSGSGSSGSGSSGSGSGSGSAAAS